MAAKIDKRPFLTVISLFFVLIGAYFYRLTDAWGYLVFVVSGLILIGWTFFISEAAMSIAEPAVKRKNRITGTVVFILAIIILWITFENRFDLETMAKSKSI